MTNSAETINIRNLRVSFSNHGHLNEVVHGISFELKPGECLALVGESGSGKSVTARSLIGLVGENSHVSAEKLELGDRDLLKASQREWRKIRGKKIGFVLQDALVSLDPLRTIGSEIAEPLKEHGIASRWDVSAKVQDLLRSVGVPEPELRAAQFPHELSGGLRQRALIATAIAAKPDFLIADEPTTALDATVQKQILELLLQLKRDGTSLLLVSHDLAVVAKLADRVAVMKDGSIVEEGPTDQIIRAPEHAYTRMLLAAIPSRSTRGSYLGSQHKQIHQTINTAATPSNTVLEAKGLVRQFQGPHGSLRRAVDDVSFKLSQGEVLGLVGESGSGKTTVARLALGLETPDRGTVILHGKPWSPLPEAQRRPQRAHIQAIWQDPLGSFDPRYSVGRLLGEAFGIIGVPKAEHRSRSLELLDHVGLSAQHLDRHPRQLSGGQRQRVAIARALAYKPSVLVCDEPVSALDVSIQAQVLNLLQKLRQDLGIALLFISHDLGVIQHISDRVLVMKDGRVVEQGSVDDLFDHPAHPYTRQLIEAVPSLPAAFNAHAA